jgi:hypothetical protein
MSEHYHQALGFREAPRAEASSHGEALVRHQPSGCVEPGRRHRRLASAEPAASAGCRLALVHSRIRLRSISANTAPICSMAVPSGVEGFAGLLGRRASSFANSSLRVACGTLILQQRSGAIHTRREACHGEPPGIVPLTSVYGTKALTRADVPIIAWRAGPDPVRTSPLRGFSGHLVVLKPDAEQLSRDGSEFPRQYDWSRIESARTAFPGRHS